MRLVASLLVLMACAPSGSVDVGTPDTGDTGGVDVDTDVDTDLGELVVEATVQLDQLRPLAALVSVAADVPIRVTGVLNGPGVVDRPLASAGLLPTALLPIVVLRAGATYTADLVVTASDGRTAEAQVSFVPPSPPASLTPHPKVVVDTTHEDRGLLLLGAMIPTGAMSRSTVLYAIDGEGNVVWWYHLGDTNDPLALPLVQPVSDGTFVAVTPDEVRFVDAWGNTRRSIKARGDIGRNFHHDAQLLPDGHVIFLTEETRRIELDTGPTWVTGDVVVEVDENDAPLRKWALMDQLDPTDFPTPLSKGVLFDGSRDWSHSNALVYRDEDDSILVSIRNQHAIAKFQRSTGELEWLLGPGRDFALESGDWFYAQHAPDWEDGELIVYDNGNERPTDGAPYTRVVRYALDEDLRLARQTWEWVAPSYTPFVGDVDVLPLDRYLVTVGGRSSGPSASIHEIDIDGNTLWEVDLEGFCYRSERIEETRLTDLDPMAAAIR